MTRWYVGQQTKIEMVGELLLVIIESSKFNTVFTTIERIKEDKITQCHRQRYGVVVEEEEEGECK